MGAIMAISLWQPWASLIAVGAKRFETRDRRPWAELVGKRIAIHAAKTTKSLRDLESDIELWAPLLPHYARPSALPLGAIVCTALLAGAFQCGDLAEHYPSPARRVVNRRVSRPFPETYVVEIDPYGNYACGRWAWLLEDVQRIEPPAPYRGEHRMFFPAALRGEAP